MQHALSRLSPMHASSLRDLVPDVASPLEVSKACTCHMLDTQHIAGFCYAMEDPTT